MRELINWLGLEQGLLVKYGYLTHTTSIINQITLSGSHQVVIAQWLAWQHATRKVSSSNPAMGDN